MKEKILEKVKRDLKKTKLKDLAPQMGIPYATLWRMIYGDGNKVAMEKWEKAEQFYKKAS